MNPVVAQTFLLAADPGYRYCLLRAPSAGIPLRGAIVVAAPLAEELNRSRRMIALGAERLAGEGFAVLEIDYRGCGDSSDDFGDARWDDWIDDLARGLEWVSTRYHAPAWLWAVRGGALLAASVIDRLEAAPSLLLWQPVTSGRQHLTQWLRLKIAADMLGESAGRASTAQIRAVLDAGEQVEIAGYTIHPALASGLDGAKLAPSGRGPARVVALETGAGDDPSLSPALAVCADAWRASGARVETRAMAGAAFWQTAEIAVVPALVDETVAAMRANSE